MSNEDWEWIISVNLGGVIKGLYSFIPLIRAHGEGGHIVKTSSIAGIAAGSSTDIYSATKFRVGVYPTHCATIWPRIR